MSIFLWTLEDGFICNLRFIASIEHYVFMLRGNAKRVAFRIGNVQFFAHFDSRIASR